MLLIKVGLITNGKSILRYILTVGRAGQARSRVSSALKAAGFAKLGHTLPVRIMTRIKAIALRTSQAGSQHQTAGLAALLGALHVTSLHFVYLFIRIQTYRRGC